MIRLQKNTLCESCNVTISVKKLSIFAKIIRCKYAKTLLLFRYSFKIPCKRWNTIKVVLRCFFSMKAIRLKSCTNNKY